MTPPPTATAGRRDPARTSTPPTRWRAPRTAGRRPGDAFDDQRPHQPARPRFNATASAPLALAVGHVVVAGAAVAVHESFLVGQLALAVAGGVWLDRGDQRRVLGLGAALGAAAAAGLSLLRHSPDPAIAVAAAVVVSAVIVGFGLLPRGALRSAVTDARRSEQERADAEVLRLIDDARRFRALGGRSDDDDHGRRRDIGGAVAQRDRLYRLMGLIDRGLAGVSGVALYTLDDNGTALRLVEQLHNTGGDDGDDGDASNHARLALGARGVGPAGLLGLAIQRKAPLRVVDADGAAVRAHRKVGPPPTSTMVVPLLSAGGAATGVIVIDRVEPVAFTVADEAFARAAAVEVLDGLAMEALIDDLDAERRRTDRVFAAARALAGASRRSDVYRVTLDAVAELCAGAAVVDVNDDNGTRHFSVVAARGLLAGLADATGVLDPTSFSARAVVEGAPLPHVSLDKASPRPMLTSADLVAADAVGDLRAIPLVVAGEASGILLVAVRPGERLRPALVDATVAVADVVALALSSAKAFDAVEKKATTDGLTGVWNRRTLDEKLAEAVARAKRSKAPLCVVMTDVDHFKSVNDTWGHATGDEVLKGVARALQDVARTTDIVGRLGGEEFVVVCEGTDVEGATIVAERMRQTLKQLQFETPKGPLSVTSSFGVALLLPDDDDGHATLEQADKFLYKAKMAGRDRVVAG